MTPAYIGAICFISAFVVGGTVCFGCCCNNEQPTYQVPSNSRTSRNNIIEDNDNDIENNIENNDIENNKRSNQYLASEHSCM